MNGKIAACYQARTASSPFVRVLEGQALPDTKNVAGTNVIEIAWRLDPRTGRLIVMSARTISSKAPRPGRPKLQLMCGFSRDGRVD